MRNKPLFAIFSFTFLLVYFVFPKIGLAQYTGGPSGRPDAEASEDVSDSAPIIESESAADLEAEVIASKKKFQQEEILEVEEPVLEPEAKDPFESALEKSELVVEEKDPEPIVKKEEVPAETPAQEINQDINEEDFVKPVEIDGDTVEFLQDENKAIIDGNVVISKEDVKLECDHVEYFHLAKTAVAQGHVVLTNPQGKIRGDELTFNFETMTGSFSEAKITSEPYYGGARKIEKVGENKIEMQQGYMTTCDLDKPHYKLNAKNIEVYPKDKIVAKNLTFLIGKVPIFYFPQYSKMMEDSKPKLLLTPGYDKEWGMFLLTSWRYFFNENFKGNLRVDFREKKDVASGIDTFYKVPNYGEGLVKLYYMNERNITSKRWWEERPSPTIERERFKAEWRHNWKIDSTTRAIWQYYKLSDSEFLKDYFEREYDKDPNPETYFLFTKSFDKGVFSFRTDKRINRFVSSVERLPQIGYDFLSQEVGKTNLYFQSTNLYSNLSYPDASPSEVRKNTHRIDSKNRISYPVRLGIFDLVPYVGERATYYSKTKSPSKYNTTRTIFETGAEVSTKFYKTLDTKGSFWGIDFNRLRHIITPTVAYSYVHEPSLSYTNIDLFDAGIDDIQRSHKIDFTLDNRFQTKRDDKTVDLLLVSLTSDFLLKEDPGSGSFNTVKSDIEFRPADWLTFFSDTEYSANQEHLISSNQEIFIKSQEEDKWTFGVGKRYHRDSDDELTSQWSYRINPKWKFSVYGRFNLDGGNFEEHQYTITRDLHCWEADVSFSQTKSSGSEIWVVFRVKAFPDMVLDLLSTSFNRRKVGTD
ncbi:MAG: LptA/OstA family protein [Candidatus Aceula meridiana]|nr:LptA/OstA family protein [Candidatus Aceula meridiana]